VESSVLGIVIDRDGVPLYANRTYAEILGYGGPEEIVALGSLNSLYAGTELDRINSYRSTCQRGWCAPKEYEFQGVKKDGSLIWIRAHLNTVTWNGGAAVQWTIVDITLRKSYEHRLYYQANFDGVTGLPNRTLALERLQNAVAAARRDQRPLAILFIDVDHFKKINDTLGHAQGDLLLELVGERMKACIREPDTVARMGGDEFAVILPDVRDSQDVAAVARRILDSFAKPFKLDGFETFVTASIGIALGPENGDDAETLLRNADAALYSAKEKGRNTYCFFNRELTEKAAERLRMEAHLRRALEREEFWLAYQPLVDIRSGRLAGAEVLLRWRNESLGQVNTDDFISLAESTGLIVPIGQWVLDTACRQASRWQTEGLGPIPLSINVSSCQFRGPFLADAVSAALRTNGMSPSCLELEITERLLMGNHPKPRM
jgi:diguanylate cyclase (GGDEF)-like protein/PAS domain S-box-containing protein